MWQKSTRREEHGKLYVCWCCYWYSLKLCGLPRVALETKEGFRFWPIIEALVTSMWWCHSSAKVLGSHVILCSLLSQLISDVELQWPDVSATVLIINHLFESNILWFQLLRCEHIVLVFPFYDSKRNIFRFGQKKCFELVTSGSGKL